ncbi:ExbD/TolR family protein [Novosphingobium piscinae]|uniref:Biopolymer transporter ExbD n=1 Tax=Novosphingobium piscinae TaxID=1507448 RepID=A0A7X1G192_9SPHN|nr:biopolymer transporter ExbD [Novosphingobium piscinae]MBC2670750.1 biopolymer transporter ExbD [Novosphingobium piscinae]
MAMGTAGGGGLGRARRRGRRGKRGAMAEINVTPLVDVMLVLLIIFMVTAPLLSAGVPVDLPDSRAKALPQQPRQVTISMTPDGKTYLDAAEIAPGELADRLAGIAPGADGKPPLVTLRADRGLPYGQVMAVMGELNHAGFNAISLVTNGSVTAP